VWPVRTPIRRFSIRNTAQTACWSWVIFPYSETSRSNVF
jgi:hypothetical protein